MSGTHGWCVKHNLEAKVKAWLLIYSNSKTSQICVILAVYRRTTVMILAVLHYLCWSNSKGGSGGGHRAPLYSFPNCMTMGSES